MPDAADVALDHPGTSNATLTPATQGSEGGLQTTNEKRIGSPAHLPEDLVICIARCLHWRDLIRTARVCRQWRSAIVQCAPLWATLDLYTMGHHSLRVLPHFLRLSADAPLTVLIWFIDDDAGNNMAILRALLEPHLHRLRALTVRSRRRSNYTPMFALLQRAAPMLCYLDISRDHRESVAFETAPTPSSNIFALAPNLCSVNWGSHLLPDAPNRFSEIPHIRIAATSSVVAKVFSLFPRATTLCLDSLPTTRRMERLPADHPLLSLELRVQPIEQTPYNLPWAHFRTLGLTRVGLLRLHSYSAAVVVSACEDPEWQLQSLTIDYDDFVDASFARRGNPNSQCQMTAMTPSRGNTWSMQRVLSETAWLRALASLTLSLALSEHQKRPLLLPRGALPALREFSLLCGMRRLRSDGAVKLWGSLFDADIMATCGIIIAPQLRVMRLLTRACWAPNDDTTVAPAEVARFIAGHVRVAGARVPLLKVTMALSFAEDEAGMAALRAAVDTIEHWV